MHLPNKLLNSLLLPNACKIFPSGSLEALECLPCKTWGSEQSHSRVISIGYLYTACFSVFISTFIHISLIRFPFGPLLRALQAEEKLTKVSKELVNSKKIPNPPRGTERSSFYQWLSPAPGYTRLSLCGHFRCLRNSTRTGAPCRPRKDPRYTKWGFMAGGRGASISLCCS